MEEYFDILEKEVNTRLVSGMGQGTSYIKWPDHYMEAHLSDDMRNWAELSGGIPFGRLRYPCGVLIVF